MRPVLDLTLSTFRPYAEQHGYDLIIGSGDDAGRGPAWAKIVLLRRLLASYDEVLWMDSDILILDSSLDLADAVPEDCFQGLVEQIISDEERAINTGVWFVRSGDQAEAFLSATWDNNATGEQGMWDNLQVLDLLGYSTFRPFRPLHHTRWRDGTALIDPEWNVMREEKGRFRHYSAMSNQERRFLMWFDLHANYPILHPLKRRAWGVAHRLYSRGYFRGRLAGDNTP
jgi:hypothetical protein